MRARGEGRRRGWSGLGIGLLILGLIHTPLPEPDFHNLRHHDAPGEVCEHHDHLLRWHPGAGVAQDVAVLHWHWFFPAAQPVDSPAPGSGPAFHAHVADWQASDWDQAPSLSPDTSTRLEARTAPSPAFASTLLPIATLADHAPGPRPPLTFGATFAPRASLPTLLSRWVC